MVQRALVGENETSEHNKGHTEGITFRLDKEMLSQLRSEAQDKEISTNTLANQIFRAHINWTSNAGKAGFVSFPRSLLAKLIEGYTDEQVTEFAKLIAQKEIPDIVLLQRNEYTIKAFLDVIESWARSCGFATRQSVNGNVHTYVIQHDMGMKWSIYLRGIFDSIIAEIGTRKPEIRITNYTVVLKVEV